MKPVRALFSTVEHYLHHPTKMLWICLTILSLSLLLDGSFFRLWSLYREDKELSQRMKQIRWETAELKMKLKRAKDPDQIQLDAQDRLELAGEGDLIFVFSDENGLDAPDR